MTSFQESLAEAVRKYPVLYDKSLRDFKDRNKKNLAWNDVALALNLKDGRQFSSLIHLFIYFLI